MAFDVLDPRKCLALYDGSSDRHELGGETSDRAKRPKKPASTLPNHRLYGLATFNDMWRRAVHFTFDRTEAASFHDSYSLYCISSVYCITSSVLGAYIASRRFQNAGRHRFPGKLRRTL